MDTSADSIRTQVRDYIVSNLLAGDDRGLEETTELMEARILDSFSVMELNKFLEESFAIQIELADMTKDAYHTIHGIVALVERARARASG